MASFVDSMLPPDIREAIRVAKEQLPAVVSVVQAAIVRIESKQDLILSKLEALRLDLDPTAVPEVLPSQQLTEIRDQRSEIRLRTEN